jgi:hypothetical protein
MSRRHPEPGPPENEWPGYRLDWFLNEFRDRLRANEEDVRHLRETTDVIRSEMGRLDARMGDLDQRIRRVQALLTDQREDLTDETSLIHAHVAKEYSILVEQRLRHAATEFAQRAAPGGERQSYRVARIVESLCNVLFRDGGSSLPAYFKRLQLDHGDPWAAGIESVAHESAALRAKAAESADEVDWDFSAELDAPMDEERQRPWGSCDPADPVRFVVAPAYVARGVIYRAQLVYTSDRPIEDERRTKV